MTVAFHHRGRRPLSVDAGRLQPWRLCPWKTKHARWSAPTVLSSQLHHTVTHGAGSDFGYAAAGVAAADKGKREYENLRWPKQDVRVAAVQSQPS